MRSEAPSAATLFNAPALPLSEAERRRLSVLFVSETFDAPFRYRCVHACEQLRASGVVANTARLDDPALLREVAGYSVVVLFRLRYSERVAEIASAARAAGARIGFDIDDLIFDPGFEALMPFLAEMPRPKVAEYRASFVAFGKTLELADFCIGSTPPIAAHFERLGKRAYPHPNLLSADYVRLGSIIYPLRERLLRPGTIGYMSGSNTHDRDLSSIAPALAEVLRRNDEASLLLCGPVIPPDELRFAEARIIRLPYQDFRVYPWLMARCSAIVAPLAAVNDFANAKSSLKVFEAGAFGVPVVASPSEPYRAAVEHERSGFIASTSAEWMSALHELLSAKRSLEVGAAARQVALARYSQLAYANVLARLLLENAGAEPRQSAKPRAIQTDPRSFLRRSASIARHSIEFAFKEKLPTPPFPLPTACLEPEPAELTRLVGAWLREASRPGGEVREADEPVGRCLLQGGLLPLESPCVHQIGAVAATKGAPRLFRATGPDPFATFPQPHPSGPEARWLYVRMDTAPRATAQFFWRRDGEHFTEAQSVSFAIGGTSGLTEYLFDLSNVPSWPKQGGVVEFRFDPSDAPEPFALDRVAVLDRIPPVTQPVDIVVPIYNAREFNLRCIESVRRHATGDWRLIAVNDASPDDRVQGDLDGFARLDDRIVVLANEKNLGFVGTANRGMRAARPGADVLLLNSDTEVFEGFLERLRAATYCTPRSGIVTPFSNNATLCSIPEFGKDNPIPEGHTPESFARAVAGCSELLRPELVTGVGFCMYLRRAVLDEVGLLDEETFGRGFGEENDLCQRARKLGWEVRLADDVFVWHKGKASFGSEGHELDRKNARLLEQKHPGYHAEVARFFERNPLRPLHRRVKLAIPRTRPDTAASTLFLVHGSPFAPNAGGTEFHVKDLVRSLKLPRAVIAYPEAKRLVFAEVLDGRVDQPELFAFPIERAPERFGLVSVEVERALEDALRLFRVGAVHLHHLMFWPVASVHRALVTEQVPYVYTVHDYLAACPSWNLINLETAASCQCSGEVKACMGALFSHLDERAPRDPERFKARHSNAFRLLLEDARAIVAPSAAAARNLVRQVGSVSSRTEVLEHGYDGERRARTGPFTGLRKVAIAGAVAHKIKGSEQYLALIERTRALGLEWHFFGPTDLGDFEARVRAAAGPSGAVVFHGPYPRQQLPALLAENAIDVSIQLPIWDETFSYVLSESWLAGVPVIASSRGAIAERVRSTGAGWVVEGTEAAAAQLEALQNAPAQVAEASARATAVAQASTAENAARYLRLYERTGLSPSEPRPPLSREELAVLELHSTARAGSDGGGERQPGYQRSRWYPMFLRIKHLVPASARSAGRSFLTRKRSARTLATRELLGAAHHGLEEVRGSSSTFEARAAGDDPQLILSVDVEPALVRGLQLRFRVQNAPLGAFQVFWTHDEAEGFSEQKSARLDFESASFDWTDCWLPLDSEPTVAQWRAGERVRKLRIDPVNVSGASFGLGPITLVRA